MPISPEIHWKRLFAEGAAIVASILLAFAIDAWWEERGIRIEEQQVLLGLQEEFQSIHELLSLHLNQHREELLTMERFLAFDAAVDSDAAGEIVDAIMLELLRPRTSDLGNGTLSALINSGRIEILQSRILRKHLAAWPGIMGEVLDDQANATKSVFEISIPYFIAKKIPAGATMSQWYDSWPTTPRKPSADPAMVAQLLGDAAFRTMVEIRYGFMRHTTEEFEVAIAAANTILAEIDASE